MTHSATLRKCLTGQTTLAAVSWQRALKSVLFCSLAGAGIALVLEPDHTSHMPLLAAYGLWASHIFFALLLFVGTVAAVLRAGAPDPLPAAVAVLLLPFLFAPISLGLDIGFGNPDDELTSAAGIVSIYLSEVWAVVPVSLAAALVMTVLLYQNALAQSVQTDEPLDDAQSQAPPVLHDAIPSIPRSLGNDIIRLHAQDHYVEVVTAEGRTLILERLGDCIDKLSGFSGLQCHRSHWVSLRHVRGLSPSGSAYVCALSNGDQVPVSRRRYAALKGQLNSDRQVGTSEPAT